MVGGWRVRKDGPVFEKTISGKVKVPGQRGQKDLIRYEIR